MDIDLVIEGGGVKGILFVGALEVLSSAGLRPVRLAGTSAGAIVASLLAAGYTPAELRAILMELDFERFRDGPTWRWAQALAIFTHCGVHPGEEFLDWIEELLEAKGIRTFADLDGTGTDATMTPISLRVVASDLNRDRMLVLPDDAGIYQLDPRALAVAQAVRMSMSIPFVFRPVWLPRRRHRTPGCIVDGGLVSNFPTDLFDDSPRPTIGLRQVDSSVGAGNARPVRGLRTFARAIADTAMSGHDNRHIETAKWLRTILIPNLGVPPTAFGIDRETKERMYESGRMAAHAWLDRGGLDTAVHVAAQVAQARVTAREVVP